MDIKDAIIDIDKEITSQEKYISHLKLKKDKYTTIQTQYPTAKFEHNTICLDSIWEKITCMRLERRYKYANSIYTAQIVANFFVGKKTLIEGMRVSVQPFDNIIAEIKNIYSYGYAKNSKTKEITVFDYKTIPVECPRRKTFIKRIKMNLIQSISYENLTLTDNSFEKEELMKLILLK
jgi:hypothetical protein